MLEYILNLDLRELLGVSPDLLLAAMTILLVILIIVMIVNSVKMSRLRKKYLLFMGGRDAKSLEKLLSNRLSEMDRLIASDAETQEKIDQAMGNYNYTYQKIGLVKYDAFEEQGGRLSFSLCLLNLKNDGFILNAVHSREGCYTYLKEIISGNPITMISAEEREALDMALNYRSH